MLNKKALIYTIIITQLIFQPFTGLPRVYANDQENVKEETQDKDFSHLYDSLYFETIINESAHNTAVYTRQEAINHCKKRETVIHNLENIQKHIDSDGKIANFHNTLTEKYGLYRKKQHKILNLFVTRMLVAVRAAANGYMEYAHAEIDYAAEEALLINNLVREFNDDEVADEFFKELLTHTIDISLELNWPQNKGQKNRMANLLAKMSQDWQKPRFWESIYLEKKEHRAGSEFSNVTLLTSMSGLLTTFIPTLAYYIDVIGDPGILAATAIGGFAAFAGWELGRKAFRPLAVNPPWVQPKLRKDYERLLRSSSPCQKALEEFYPGIELSPNNEGNEP